MHMCMIIRNIRLIFRLCSYFICRVWYIISVVSCIHV